MHNLPDLLIHYLASLTPLLGILLTSPAPPPPPLGWSYDHETCTAALRAVEEEQGWNAKGTSEGFFFMRVPLIPFQHTHLYPPNTLVGHILYEGGDGCRYYYPEVAYHFVRNAKPRVTRRFATVRNPPKFLYDIHKYATTGDDTPRIRTRVIHRGSISLYEVNYTHLESGDILPARKAALSCFQRTSTR